MKTLYTLILLAFIGLSVNAQGTWSSMNNFSGTARSGAVSFTIGTKVYVGTGGDNRDFWEYDPATDTWTQKADFGGNGRGGAVGFSIGNKGYIGTGMYGGTVRYKDFWEYDPATDTWTQKADFLGTARYGAVGFSIGNKGYIGTGNDGVSGWGDRDDFYEYNPATDTWSSKAPFGGGQRQGAVGFSICDKGYVGTGIKLGFSNTNFKDFWEYDPTSNTWIQKADYGGGLVNSAVGFSICTLGYVGTGTSGVIPKMDFWKYNPATDAWVKKTDLPSARYGAIGCSIGGKGYVGTGYDGMGGNLNDFLEYTPDTIYIPQQPGTISGNATVCESSTKTYSITAVSCANSYTWTVPSGSTINSGQGTTSISVTFGNASGNISVTANNDCGNSTASTKTITVHSLPNVFIVPNGSTTFCKGDSVILIAFGGNTYTWSTGSNDSSIVVKTSNTYSVTGTDTNGCQNSDAIAVTVNPTYSFTIDTILNNGDSVKIGNNIYTITGTYTDTLMSSDGCDSIITLNLTVLTGISDVTKKKTEVKISPNPFSEMATIEILHFPSLLCDLIIYDVLGQEVLKQKILNQKMQISREHLSEGIYFYQLKNEKGILANGKFAIQ